MSDSSALVVFSGGQDSTTCLAWSLNRYDRVATIGFEYGQRHRVEMDCRKRVLSNIETVLPEWSGKFSGDTVLDIGLFTAIGGTALTSEAEIKMGERGLPNTFVPGRNLIFLATAAACAYRLNIRHLVTGVCETDFSGYPDCRDDTMKALQVAINLGMDERFVIHTPLMWINKAATWRLAEHLGGEALLECILEHTHTCYRGDRGERHAWGYGCGNCPACDLRARGWEAFDASRRKTA